VEEKDQSPAESSPMGDACALFFNFLEERVRVLWWKTGGLDGLEWTTCVAC
jgi:hypothetical protein